jgi:predicted DNA-binding ribbon-helix-helix protein
MTDKEVGELWALAQAPALESSYVVKLIRKLVEERANFIQFTSASNLSCLNRALREFGIDPESWGKSRD